MVRVEAKGWKGAEGQTIGGSRSEGKQRMRVRRKSAVIEMKEFVRGQRDNIRRRNNDGTL